MPLSRAVLACAAVAFAVADSQAQAALGQDARAAPVEAPRAAPAPAPGQRLSFKGYSVRLPHTRAWRLLAGGPFDLGLLAARSPTHSLGITASAVAVERRFATPQAFLEYMRARLHAEPDRARFSEVDIDVALAPAVAPHCVRARSRARDHGDGRGGYLMLEIWNLTCLHPQAPDLAVSLIYYERYSPDEAAGAVQDEGRRFVDSLRFEANL